MLSSELPQPVIPANSALLAQVLALSRSLTLNQALDQQFDQVVRVIEAHLGFGCVILNIYHPGSEAFYAAAAAGVPDEALARLKAHPIPHAAMLKLCSPDYQLSSSYFISAEVEGDPDQRSEPWCYYPPIEPSADPERWRRGDDLLVPLREPDGSWLGLISVDQPVDGRRPPLEKIQALELVATQVATLIQNSRLYERARLQAERLAVLNEIGSVLASTLDPLVLYETIIAQIKRVLAVDSAYIVLYDAQSDFCNTVYCIDQDEVVQGRVGWPLNEGPASHVIRARRPYMVNQPGDAIQERGTSFGRSTRHSASALHVPMMTGDHVVGVISVQSYQANAYTDDDMRVLSTIASQAAVAIYNAQLVETLQRTIDSLRVTQGQLVRQEKLAALGQLAAGVAHELNNPLAGVIGFTELLLAEPLPRALRKDLVRIHHAATRCTRIVRNLLTFARPSVDERQAVDLNQVVNLVLELHSYPLHIDSVQLSTSLEPDLPQVMADPYQIQQVLVNLITNAHHAMRAVTSGRSLRIATSHERDWVSLTVSDSGPGIDPEHLPRIFDPFFSTKEVGQGTGLGLSTAYSIIEAHDGRLEVETELGSGTTFTIMLPLLEAEFSSVEVAPSAEAPPLHAPAPASVRILVVDDEPIVARLIERILTRAGYKIDVANDGKAALERLRSSDYGAILMDLKMPGLDGPSLYARLEQESPALLQRVLFTTGDSVSEESRQFLDRAGRPFISKPFTVDLLVQSVREILQPLA